MRNFVSILFIILILLNVMGYYGLFLGLEFQNRRVIIQRFDSNDYKTSELITLKIPMVIPYGFDSDFERVNGQFEYKGEFYHLVKQRLSKDTLQIVCVRDQKSKQIHEALADYVKTFSDKPVDTHSGPRVFFHFGKDYFAPVFLMDLLSPGCAREIIPFSELQTFTATHCTSVLHPPA